MVSCILRPSGFFLAIAWGFPFRFGLTALLQFPMVVHLNTRQVRHKVNYFIGLLLSWLVFLAGSDMYKLEVEKSKWEHFLFLLCH
jgi:hypothetical protein